MFRASLHRDGRIVLRNLNLGTTARFRLVGGGMIVHPNAAWVIPILIGPGCIGGHLVAETICMDKCESICGDAGVASATSTDACGMGGSCECACQGNESNGDHIGGNGGSSDGGDSGESNGQRPDAPGGGPYPRAPPALCSTALLPRHGQEQTGDKAVPWGATMTMRGWTRLLLTLMVDVLVVGFLGVGLCAISTGLLPERILPPWESATFVLRDGTRVEAPDPGAIRRVMEEHEGQIASAKFRRRPWAWAAFLVTGALPLAFAGWTAFRERGRLLAWFRPRAVDLPLALAGALAFLALSAGATWALGRGGEPPFPGADPRSPLPWFLAVGLAPLGEELWFRGRLQELATELVGPRTGILLPAILFGLLHAGQQGLPVPVVVGVTFGFGVIAGLLRARTGRLVAPWLAHALGNAGVLLIAVASS